MMRNTKRRKTHAPGDIVAYRGRPRHKGEILCHNHVIHPSWMQDGLNGFRWFSLRRGRMGEFARTSGGQS